jgi:molybdopterin-biosynthesis enzyme MoeA-like protein
MQNFGIYIIGDEILSGKRQDKHLTQAISILKARGLSLAWAEYLADDPERLTEHFKRSLANGDIVFSFGGIGATPDDFTRQSAAAAANLPIERHAGAVAEIEARFGESAYPNRVLMTDFPAGVSLIPNPINRVAGFSLGLNPAQPTHHFLPGFPEMAHPMMEWVLDHYYSQHFHQYTIVEASILVTSTESQLLSIMQDIVVRYPTLKLFSLPRLTEIRQVELGVKGAENGVLQAINEIKASVTAAGFAWSIISN